MYKYQMYHNKAEGVIEIKPTTKTFADVKEAELIKVYNDCYYLSSDKKALKKIAADLKESWLQEAQNRLQKISAIKI